MTMSDTVVQAFRFAEEGRATATENGCFDGQEVNKVKSPADCGGLLFQNEDDKFDRHVPETEQIHDESRQKRGISFPRDSCVSGYCEPPDPWREALTWTSEDILSAYKRSCEKHGTKPLSKILQQLEGFICNGKRKEKLVLKGEKIDSKQCEAFEEILRRVQFKSIDLEACHLDDESAVAWFDMIEYYESACCLSIAYNKNIGVRGWQACSRLIRRTPCLTSLDIRNCDMNDRSIPVFGRALKLGSHLTVLHMENMYLSGRSLIILVAALKLNEVLQELFLADNRLMPSDGIQLGNLLKYNHSLTLLDLRNNHLQDVGVSHVCDGLYEQNLDKGLRTLVLWNNQITYQAMASLSRALGSTKCLETLNLGHNNVTNEGIHVLKEGLLKSKSLLRLGLQSTRLTCEGAVALAEYVADSFSLLRLDLRENDIKTAGLMALSLALKVNESVTRMDIDRETKKESGMKDYADQQRRLQQEIKEYLERNQQRVFQKEEEDRQRLEERAQVEMVICQPVQSDTTFAQETIQPQPEMIYAPTSSMESERQRRPSLLFKAHCLTPQESLESPHCGDVHFFPGNTGKVVIPEVSLSSPPLSLELPNPLTSPTAAASIVESTSGDNLAPLSNPLTSALHSPPVELLLSPQYYPKPTARKIFSVSRVIEVSPASPTVSKTGLLDIGASKVSNTSVMTLSGNNGAGGSLSSISPTLLCQDLSVKTVNDYIQQIVNDSTSLAGNCEEKEAARQKNELCVTDSIMEDSFCGGQENVLNQWQEREDDYQSIQDVCLLAQDGCGNFDPLGVMQAQASPISREVMSSTSCDITQDNPAYFCLDSESYPYRGTEDVRVDRDNMQTEGEIVSREDEILSRNIAIAGADVECIPLSAEFSLSNQIPGQGLCVPQSEVIADSVQADLKETEDHIDILAENDLAVEEELVRSALLENSHMDKMKSIAACVVGQKLSQKSSPQLPATHLVPEEPSLFETMEFPSFDLNEDDLNLFGIGDSKLSSSSGGSNSGLSDTWFAIDACNLGGHQKEENVGDAGEKQPDFFTPLSMNGLTQELASALNSIDETLSGTDEQEDRSVMYSTDKALDMEDKGSLF